MDEVPGMSSLSVYATVHNALWCRDNPGDGEPQFRQGGEGQLSLIDAYYSEQLIDSLHKGRFEKLWTELACVACGIAHQVFKVHGLETAIDTIVTWLDEQGFVPNRPKVEVWQELAASIEKQKILNIADALKSSFVLSR